MIDIVCVKWGDRYSAEYVNKLYLAVERNVTVPHTFTCFCDNPEDLICPTKPLIVDNLETWWNKMTLFSRDLPVENEYTMFLDLDIVITNSLDDVIEEAMKNDFNIIKGVWAKWVWNSSFIIWRRKVLYHLGEDLGRFVDVGRGKGYSDQDFIRENSGVKPVFFQDMFPDQIVSYKAKVLGQDMGGRVVETPVDPESAKIVYFHGKPRPHEVQAEWITKHWSYDGPCGSRLIKGFLFPEGDVICSDYIFNEVTKLRKVFQFCERKKGCGTIVQAGGNVGIFPYYFSKVFDQVYTFEPDPKNFQCLEFNLKTCDNVRAFNCGLGDRETRASMRLSSNNCGAHRTEEDENGDVSLLTIDCLGLSECDMIYLDIEGFEKKALTGASETIRKYRPLILIENKGLVSGYSDGGLEGSDRLREWICSTFGYVYDRRLMRDDFFVPKE